MTIRIAVEVLVKIHEVESKIPAKCELFTVSTTRFADARGLQDPAQRDTRSCVKSFKDVIPHQLLNAGVVSFDQQQDFVFYVPFDNFSVNSPSNMDSRFLLSFTYATILQLLKLPI